MEGQINANGNNMTQISALVLAAKARDKRELHRLVGTTLKIYIPGMESITVYHMKDLFSGDKNKVMCDKVKHFSVPYFDNLTVEDMLNFIDDGYPKAVNSFPERRKETLKMPRWYIVNIISTQVEDPFYDWVDRRIKERND